MEEFFWNLFQKSGSVDAFLAYREFSEREKHDKYVGSMEDKILFPD